MWLPECLRDLRVPFIFVYNSSDTTSASSNSLGLRCLRSAAGGHGKHEHVTSKRAGCGQEVSIGISQPLSERVGRIRRELNWTQHRTWKTGDSKAWLDPKRELSKWREHRKHESWLRRITGDFNVRLSNKRMEHESNTRKTRVEITRWNEDVKPNANQQNCSDCAARAFNIGGIWEWVMGYDQVYWGLWGTINYGWGV